MDPKSRLVDGNAMFRKSVDPLILSRMSKQQEATFAILTCSDARVDPVKVFNLSIGDAFVVRAAGNTTGDLATLGSLEYAVEHLHIKALVVLGHTDCDAVKMVLDRKATGNLSGAIRDIESASYKLEGSDERNPSAVALANVRLQLRMLEYRSTIIAEAVTSGRLVLLGAMLDLSNGAVNFV